MSVRLRLLLVIGVLIAILAGALYLSVRTEDETLKDAREISAAGFLRTLSARTELRARQITTTELDSQNIALALQAALSSNEEVNQSLLRFFSSSETVSNVEFNTFLRDLESRYPQILAVEYVPVVRSAERDEFIEENINTGNPNFTIYELTETGEPVEAANRTVYYPITYIAPLAGNEEAVGFDQASNPERLLALEAARDTGRTTISAPVEVVQVGEENQLTVLMVTPLYYGGAQSTVEARQRSLRGFIATVLDLEPFINQALSTLLQGGTIQQIEDVSGSEPLLLYTGLVDTDLSTASAPNTFVMDVFNRQWRVTVPQQVDIAATLAELEATLADMNTRITALETGNEDLGFYGLERHNDPDISTAYNRLVDLQAVLNDNVTSFLNAPNTSERVAALALIDTNERRVADQVDEMLSLLQAEADARQEQANQLSFATVVLGLIMAGFGALTVLQVANNLRRLQTAAQQLAAGELNTRIPVVSENEIGRIGQSLNEMAVQLQGIFASLEQQIEERTRDLATVVSVSNQIATVQEQQRLLQDVADLTKERFRLYHSHIYLLNETGNRLVLAAGAGYVGRQMVAERRVIDLDNPQSIVATAARTRQPVIINDVTQSPTFLPHPLLPYTKSELAIALIAHSELLGVLDVQSERVNHFDEEVLSAFGILAGQIATSVDNARLFGQSSRLAAEMQTVAELSAEIAATLEVDQLLQTVANLTKERFKLYHAHIYLLDTQGENLVLTAGAGNVGRKMVREGFSIPLNRETSLVARAARQQSPVIVNDVTQAPDFLPNPLLPQTKSEMAVPLLIGEDLLGVLDVQSDQVDRFTEEDMQVKSTLAAQIAIALQNARTFTQAQQARDEAATLYLISKAINTAEDANELVGVVQSYIAHPEATSVSLSLFENLDFDTAKTVIIAAEWRSEGTSLAGMIIPLELYPFTKLLSHQNISVFNDVTADPRLDVTSASSLQANGVGALLVVPLSLGGRWLGSLSLSTPYAYQHSEEQIRLARSAAEQIAAAVDRLRLVEQTQKRATELQTVAELSAEIASTLDIDRLLSDVANLTRDRFKLYHAHIYLLDASGQNLVLAAGAGEVGQIMAAEGRSIALSRQQSLVARAARERRAVRVNNVLEESGFLPNPLLPETRSEMAVPMLSGEQVIGVLDVQANVVNRFTEEDVRIKTTLASQVAVAVQNARLYTEAAQRSKDIADLQFSIDQSAIVAFTDVTGKITYVNDLFCEVSKYSREELIGQDHRIINSGYHTQEFIRNVWVTIANGRVWHGEFCNRAKDGSIYWVDTTIVPLLNEQGKPYRYVAIRFLITEQKAQEQELARRAVELQTVAEVSAEAATTLDPVRLLQDVSNLTKERFNLYHAHIYLLDDAGENLVLAAGAGEPGRIMVAEGRSIPLNRVQSLVARAARERHGVVVNDVTQAPDFLPNPLLPQTRSEMAIPMLVGENLIGVLDVQANVVNRFTDEDVRIKTTLASQVAIAVQNARAFANVEAAREETARIYNLSVDMIGAAKLSTGMFTDLNPAWTRILGYSYEELTAQPFINFVHPDDQQKTLAEVERQMAEGSAVLSFQNRYLAKDGSIHVLSWNATPVIDIDTVYFVTRDVTEEQKVQQEIQNALEALRLRDRAIESSPSGISIADARQPDLPLIYINNGFSLTTGYSWEEAIGRNCRFLQNEDRDQPALADLRRAIKAGREVTVTLRNYRKNGELFYNELRIAPIFDDQGELTHFVGVSTDITDRIEAQAETSRRAVELQTVAEVSAQVSTALEVNTLLKNVADLTKDRFKLYHTHIYLLDEANERLVLAAGAGDVGDRMVAAGHGINLNQSYSLVATAAREKRGVVINNVTEEENFLPNPLLPYTKSEMAIPMISGDEVIGVLDVQSDTINRFTDNDVQIKTTLADQIAVAVQNARLYAEQVETTERLREVDRLKSEFLASMSHELRTPLNSIIGYAEVILDGLDGDITDEMREDVDAIHGSGKLLLNLINDILDLAKIEAQQLDLDVEPVEVKPFIMDVVETSRILVKDKAVALRVDVPDDMPMIEADRIRLQQVLNNLISNASKFTEEGSITVAAETNGSKVIFKVIDTGMGIPKDKQDLIFERFRQADQSSTRKAGGTGLGLAITRQLVEMHGGEIWVESEPGTGSTFAFTVPISTNGGGH